MGGEQGEGLVCLRRVAGAVESTGGLCFKASVGSAIRLSAGSHPFPPVFSPSENFVSRLLSYRFNLASPIILKKSEIFLMISAWLSPISALISFLSYSFLHMFCFLSVELNPNFEAALFIC